jgi:hypothetical protein
MAAAAGIATKFLKSLGIGLGLLTALGLCLPEAQARERKGVHLGAIPISSFSTDAGYTAGVLAQRFDYGAGIEPGPGLRPFQSLLTLQVTYSTRGPRDAWISYESFWDRTLDPLGWRWSLDAYGMESTYQRYYGLGPDSSRLSLLEREGFYFYDRSLFLLSGSIRKRIPELGGLDLQLGASQVATRSDPGARDDSQYRRDFGEAPLAQTYTQLSLRGIWERRNSEFIPTRGSFASFSLSGAPLPGWSRLDLDFRRYFEFLPERGLWLASQIRYTGVTDDTPLHEKARLGSLGTFRGVALNRYLSNHSASLRNELRSIWFKDTFFGLPLKLGSGLYIDAGKVSDTLEQIPQTPLRLSWGLALFSSYFTDDFLGSADFGFSPEGSSVYLRLGHAF